MCIRDRNWDVLISMKINKVLSATINTTLKYDNDVKTFDDNGVKKGDVYKRQEMGKVLKEIDDPWYKEGILKDMIPY